jgi:hypothetical protein
MSTPLLRLAALALCGVSAAASAQTTGEKWRVTTSMQMQGMSMPGRTSEICKTSGSDEPPMQTEKNCQMYDAKRSGNTQTFKMRCTGKDAMEGTAEFTYLGPDHYKGAMQVGAQGQQMTMTYEGQKLGACDGGEMNTKAKQMVEQSQQQQAQYAKAQCREAAKAATLPSMMMNCKDPQDVKTYCSNFQTYKNFLSQADMQRMSDGQAPMSGMSGKPLDESAKLCGVSVESARSNLCSTAESKGELDFLVKECSAQALELAKAQCAGRNYTTVNEKYRGFCANFASLMAKNGDSNESATPATTTDKTKGLLNKGKKAFGGLF